VNRSSALQTEIRQTRPFRSLSQEATLGLLRTADVLRRTFGQTVEPLGLTLQQYNVLRILRGAGPDGLPTLAITERLIERTPGITRLLDRLERRSWVTRERTTGDRRKVVCRITSSGLETLGQLDEPVDELDDKNLGVLSEDELRTLIALLDRVRRDLAQPRDRDPQSKPLIQKGDRDVP